MLAASSIRARSNLQNHADRTWACDFIQTYDLLFRQVYAFFIVHLSSRRVIHVAATRNPTQAWTAQQLRHATMDGEAVLLRDRDDKFGPTFDHVAEGGQRVPANDTHHGDLSKPIVVASVLGGRCPRLRARSSPPRQTCLGRRMN